MRTKKDHKNLFSELEEWSHLKNAFSINEFLKEKGIDLSDFEMIANSNEKFMQIWGIAEERAWENVKNALFTKSLPRSKIAEYIKELDIFEGENPEEVMQSLENGQAKFELYLMAIGDTDSLKKYGRIGLKMDDSEALMKCCLDRGMISQKDYDEIMAIDDIEDV
jgi:hypothetical protein